MVGQQRTLSVASTSWTKARAAGKRLGGAQVHLNPRASDNGLSSRARHALLGVYFLPQLLSTAVSERVLTVLAHLMDSSRQEVREYRPKGLVPRGRPGSPMERIEVDLSFLRSLDRTGRERQAAQRSFIRNHLDMYREMSTILDEIMVQFRAFVEDILRENTSTWTFFA